MLTCFHENLAALRKLKKVNQREAAAALGVSQALLSHYEKGLREPGMEFLVNAANYYEVSADWLLGRTEDMNGTAVTERPAAAEREQAGGFGRRVRRDKTEVQACIGLVYDMLERMDNHVAEPASHRYINACLFRLVALLHLCGGQKGGTLELFGIPRRYIYELAREGEEAAAIEIVRLGRSVEQGRRGERFFISPENLEAEFGDRSRVLLDALHATAGRMQKRLEE
jgi:transcriptional regulator with XRE-family HTH domain